MSQYELEKLCNLGFLNNEIDVMTQEEFDNNKNLNSVLVSQNIKYYKTITYRIKNSNLLLNSNNNNNNNNNVLYYSEKICIFKAKTLIIEILTDNWVITLFCLFW